MQEDDIAQKTFENEIQIDKPGVIDQIEWLEQPDFLENDCKYKLELNSSSDSDGSSSARKKCLIIIDDSKQLHEYFSKSYFPHLFNESNSCKILELVYSSAEEEMWIHFRPSNKCFASAGEGELDYLQQQQKKQQLEKEYELSQAKNNLYCNIIEESFYPYADYIILFSNEQAKEIEEWKQSKSRFVKPSQKIYTYDKQKQGFFMSNSFDKNEDSPPTSEISWFNSNISNNNNQNQYFLQSSSPYVSSSSYSMIKTLINLA